MKTRTTSFNLPIDLLKWLDHEAKRQQRSKSKVVAMLLEQAKTEAAP